jgi:large repetitive protein
MKNTSWKKNILRTALLAVTVCALPALAGPDNVGLGDGSDGALTVNAANQVVNVYAQVTGPLAPGDTAITVGDATGIAATDLLLVLQTTGIVPEPPSGGPTPIDLTTNPVGRWEFARVASVAGNTLTLTAPLIHSYAGNVTQVIRVPEYSSLTINAARSISPAPWNGSTGGVVAFLVSGTFTNFGSIDARGRGFRGGLPVDDPSGTTGCTGLDEPAPTGAQKGEGIAATRYGTASTGRGRVGNGAGGGVCLLSGGGGGGNGGAGGQGGNTELNTDGNRAVGGEGGAALEFFLLDHLMLGGGGGAGHSSQVAGSNGGGIIFVRTGQLAGPGSFFANGNSSNSATNAGSGGGAGGTIYLRIAGSATCGAIQANGGTGGSTSSIAIGPGGGGGGGRVLFQKGSGTCVLTGTSFIGANPGTQLDPNAPGGAAYGATAGANGSSTELTGGFPVLPAPVVTTPANGSQTNDTTPTYSGTLATPFPPGTEVIIYVDGAEVARVTPDASGNWTFEPTVPLTEGNHTVNAVAINTAQGVQSQVSGTNTFTVDLTPPAAPVVTTPADGSRTNDTTPTYSGTAEPGSTVTVIVDGTPVGTTTADAAGNWSFTPTTGLSSGQHTVTATATDAAGNTSPQGNTNTFTVNATVPEAPVITGPPNNTVTNDNTPPISGTAPPNSTVTVIIDGTPVGTTTSDAAGNWTFTPTVPLPDGPHDITATTTNSVGNTSPPSNTVRITVDTGVPDTTIVSGPSDNTESASATFTFSSNETGVTYECNLDGAGYVPCTNPVTFENLAEGEHTLLVRARDGAGNVDPTPASATWTVVRATPQPAPDRDFLGDGIGCAASGGNPSSLAMMGLGLLAVLLARRRRSR